MSEAVFAAASALFAQGRSTESLAVLDRHLEATPSDYPALVLRGRIRWAMGQRFPAMIDWDMALKLTPQPTEAALLLAEALTEQGNGADAARIAAAAVRWEPARVDAWLTLARAKRCLGDGQGALSAAETALRHAPDSIEARWHACVISSEFRRYEDAGRHARELLRLQPDHPGAVSTLLDARARASAWGELPDLTARLRQLGAAAVPDAGLMDVAFASDDPAWSQEITAALAARMAAPAPRPGRTLTTGPTTICYMSPDLHEHPVSRMLLPIIRAHRRSAFRIITAGLSPPQRTGIGAAVIAAADLHLDLSGCSDDDAVARIRGANIDVLVDLAGATTRNRYGILARRPCAAQVLWLGCPTGTGASWYDAYLLDDVTAPTTTTLPFSEPVVRLPVCYHPITADTAGALPACDRRSVGLPEQAIVLACPHAPHKVRPPITAVWMRLARQHPQVVLWLDARDEDARRSIRAYAGEHGVQPERLRFWEFVPDHRQYLARLRLADLFLDCHPYGAHSTAGEAMACGLPVLTMAGRSVHARVAASMLHSLGLQDTVCNSMEEYEQRAASYCGSPAVRATAKQRAVQAARLVPDTVPRLTSHLEQAYIQTLSATRS